MNLPLRAPLAPTVTLTRVPRRVDCETCQGDGHVMGAAPWDAKTCTVCYGSGFVLNPDFDPVHAGWYCGCGTVLERGDDCSLCGAAP